MLDMLEGNEDCRKFRDALEEAAAELEGAVRAKSLMALLPKEQREHVVACSDCQQAANDLVKVKALLNGAASFAEEERPWFAARVMAAIASRERELAERVNAWTEFPRFASRLTWVAAVLLLAGTTPFFEGLIRPPPYFPPRPESIFETPQQSVPD